MTVRRRPEWTAVEVASYALGCTSLSQLTLPEVKKMAALVLRDEGDASKPDGTDPRSLADVGEPPAKARRGRHPER